MRSRGSGAFALLLLGGCAPHVSGIVQDAATGRPVRDAAVELSNRGWGSRDGQLVWDAEKIAHTTTDTQGRFGFDADGGVALHVRAPGQAQVETSLCPRSPMVVRIGGPHPELRADQRLLLGSATARDLGISVTSDESRLQIQSRRGVRFVEGTGAIPPPPPLPYDRTVDLDLRSDCGWLFVTDAAAPIAVIQVGAIGWEQDPGGPRRTVMLYTPLPGRGQARLEKSVP